MKSLNNIITYFPTPQECYQSTIAGDCDHISQLFLTYAKTQGLEGILLAVDQPKQEPDLGWNYWGGKEFFLISHYIAFFPQLSKAVDWTARQFWAKSPVPWVQTLEEVQDNWEEFPFQLQDARLHEKWVAGSQLKT